jgi:hypothetical protein
VTTPIRAYVSHAQPVTGAFAASVSAHLEVNKEYQSPWVKPCLENIANNLTALEGNDWRDRVSKLIRSMIPHDELVLAQSEIPANGQQLVTEFFTRVPLLTEEQVSEGLANKNITVELDTLMQVTFQNEKFYFADQFSQDGSIYPFCLELMSEFKKNPRLREWDIAQWWINPSDWLSGDRPRDVFLEKSEAVRAAARWSLISDDG